MSKFMSLLGLLLISNLCFSQKEVTLKVEPNPILVPVKGELKLKVTAYDKEGNELKESQTRYFVTQLKGVEQNMIFTNGIEVDSLGLLKGLAVGQYDLFIARTPNEGEAFASQMEKVQVVNQEIASINTNQLPEKIYEGSIIKLNVEVLDKSGTPIQSPDLEITSSNEKVLQIDKYLNLVAFREGKSKVTLTMQGITTTVNLSVLPNPVNSIELSSDIDNARTGDVFHFSTRLFDAKGKQVTDVPVQYSVKGVASSPGAGASSIIKQDGRFVAEKPGSYVITASAGTKSISKAVQIVPRNIERPVELMGHGTVSDQHTSDLWVWEGADGKDYAVTGTWGSNGKAYFWDVTNPANITKIDSVQVDARTVNDVKISEDGKLCIISREGASNRKNGIIIIDVTNPADVKTLAEYTERLTGGVHNLFIYKQHVYALSNGQRYEIINIEDPKSPKRVGQFELSNSYRSIHDVWVMDGIAYSSNWADGVVMVDVGNGIKGGTPANPVEIGRFHVDGDANHAAFPYKSKETGKTYVIAGDEIFPLAAMQDITAKKVFAPAGYLHIIDITDPDNPEEVARYEVPEAGSHNFWIEDDLLYVGYYNGGLRVVDLSGDLLGNLYNQGREIAKYLPYDVEGYVPNSPFVWGAQPHKGNIFFSDFNSGLWSAKVKPILPEDTKIEAK